MLNRRQIAWASQHDWFVSAEIAPGAFEGRITVRDSYTDRNGELFEDMLTWSGSFTALRAWAGY